MVRPPMLPQRIEFHLYTISDWVGIIGGAFAGTQHRREAALLPFPGVIHHPV